MTGIIVTLSATWIYLVMMVFTLYILTQERTVITSWFRLLLAVVFWFIFWPAIMMGALWDTLTEGRNV